MKDLKISPRLKLPVDIVTQTIGILAKRRAGKSYTAAVMVEQLWAARQQVVILDPKGDWWGLRSSADGKSEGIPILIIGGGHGDIKLEPGAGEQIARLIVEERVSAIIDLSELRKHEVATFCTAFLETLYRLKAQERFRTAMMLMIDEADAIAPQRPQHGEERMLGAAEDIVRRGGQRGIGCCMATQRAAVLNKNVLTQIQMLIVLRTIAPQDMDAMGEWIKVHGTAEQKKELMESLPALPIGTAWFWSPGWPTEEGIFQRVPVASRKTFDSGATPKAGETRAQPKTFADVDLAAVEKLMADAIQRAKAESPKELQKEVHTLRTEIRSLKAQLAARPKETIQKIETKVERVEVPVLRDAQVKELTSIADKINHAMEKAREVVANLNAALAKKPAAAAVTVRRGEVPNTPNKARAVPTGPVYNSPSLHVTPENGQELEKAERAILSVLAQYPEGCEIGKLALLSGYRVSGGFRNALSSLRTWKLMVGGNTEIMSITEAGTALIGDRYTALPQGQGLVQYWLNHRSLGKCERAVLAALIESPEGLGIEDLAAKVEYEVSGGFRNALSTLRTAGVITGKNTGILKASDELLQALTA